MHREGEALAAQPAGSIPTSVRRHISLGPTGWSLGAWLSSGPVAARLTSSTTTITPSLRCRTISAISQRRSRSHSCRASTVDSPPRSRCTSGTTPAATCRRRSPPPLGRGRGRLLLLRRPLTRCVSRCGKRPFFLPLCRKRRRFPFELS